MAAEMKADSAKKEAAEKLREAAAETCQAWNYRMIGFGGPVQPSPTIAEAIVVEGIVLQKSFCVSEHKYFGL
jgi:hypothetical protein